MKLAILIATLALLAACGPTTWDWNPHPRCYDSTASEPVAQLPDVPVYRPVVPPVSEVEPEPPVSRPPAPDPLPPVNEEPEPPTNGDNGGDNGEIDEPTCRVLVLPAQAAVETITKCPRSPAELGWRR